MVQGHIPDRPTWGEDLNIQKYIKDVSLGEKEEKTKEEKSISNFSVSLPWANEANRKLYCMARWAFTHVVHLGKGNTG